MYKFLLCLMGIVMGVCSAFASTPYEVTAKTSLNVRSSASAKGAVIGKLYNGERIEVVEIQGQWAVISYGGRTAYVSSRYIAPLPVSQSETGEEPATQNISEKEESAAPENTVEQEYVYSKEEPASGNYRIDSNGDTVLHYMYYGAQYDLMSFKTGKSSTYGAFLSVSSFSHWGCFHLGAELSMLINAGVIDNWGVGFDFGPSMRVDITDNVFVNIPVNVRMAKVWYEYDVNSGIDPDDFKDSETNWGAVIKPSLYFFPSGKFGMFIGPQLTIFDKCEFGMQAGIALEL